MDLGPELIEFKKQNILFNKENYYLHLAYWFLPETLVAGWAENYPGAGPLPPVYGGWPEGCRRDEEPWGPGKLGVAC